LVAAVALFAAAAILGLLSNLPAEYPEAKVAALKKRVDTKEWSAPDPVEAARYDAELYIEILDGARGNNKKKGAMCLVGVDRGGERCCGGGGGSACGIVAADIGSRI